ncbi:MAG TPA: enoyl-CoA hydratase-related protein [Thermodesulfobacteriota bacterium]
MPPSVTYRTVAGVAEIGLPRGPEPLLDERFACDLLDALERAATDDAVRVVLIGGRGFCAGLPEPLPPDAETLVAPVAAVRALAKPVVAAIGGPAVAEGLELALACDIRIASRAATFAMPQVVRGRLPVAGGTQYLPRLVPRAVAMEMLLTGRALGADEALAVGLVARVVSSDLREAARALARDIAGKAPLASRYCKEAVRCGADLPLPQALRLEADLNFLLMTTEDRAEGLRAFFEKRPPRFTGV